MFIIKNDIMGADDQALNIIIQMRPLYCVISLSSSLFKKCTQY